MPHYGSTGGIDAKTGAAPYSGTTGGIDAKTGGAPSSIHETSIADVSNRAKQNFPVDPISTNIGSAGPAIAQLSRCRLIRRCALLITCANLPDKYSSICERQYFSHGVADGRGAIKPGDIDQQIAGFAHGSRIPAT